MVSAEATGGTQNNRPATIATQKASVRVRAQAEWKSASWYSDYQSVMIVIRKYTDVIAVIGRLQQLQPQLMARLSDSDNTAFTCFLWW